MLYTNGRRVRARVGTQNAVNVNHYKTLNDLGQEVINNANLSYDDGTMHKAYDALKENSRYWQLINKQKSGYPLTPEEMLELASYTAGLASIDDLGGNHNGGIVTKVGTPDKDTQSVRKNGNGTYSVKGKPGWYTDANFS